MDNRMVFYLKANRNNSYVIPNLKHWIDACRMYENSLIFILCDNETLKERICREILIEDSNITFLESMRDCCEINTILENVCTISK